MERGDLLDNVGVGAGKGDVAVFGGRGPGDVAEGEREFYLGNLDCEGAGGCSEGEQS